MIPLQLNERNSVLNFEQQNIQDILDEQYTPIQYEQYIFYMKRIEYLTLDEFIELESIILDMYLVYDKDAHLDKDNDKVTLRGYYRYDEQAKNFNKIQSLYKSLNINNSERLWVYSTEDVSTDKYLDTTTKCLEYLIKGVVEYVEDDSFAVVDDFAEINESLLEFSFRWKSGLADTYNTLIEDIFKIKESLKSIVELETNIKYIDSMYIDTDSLNVESLSFAQLIGLFSQDIFDSIGVLYKHRSDTNEILSLKYEQYRKERSKVRDYLSKSPIQDTYPLFSIVSTLKSTLSKSFTHLFVSDLNANEVCLNENAGVNIMMDIFEILCKDTNGNYDGSKFNTIQNDEAYIHLVMLNLQAKANNNKNKNNNKHDERDSN